MKYRFLGFLEHHNWNNNIQFQIMFFEFNLYFSEFKKIQIQITIFTIE